MRGLLPLLRPLLCHALLLWGILEYFWFGVIMKNRTMSEDTNYLLKCTVSFFPAASHTTFLSFFMLQYGKVKKIQNVTCTNHSLSYKNVPCFCPTAYFTSFLSSTVAGSTNILGFVCQTTSHYAQLHDGKENQPGWYVDKRHSCIPTRVRVPWSSNPLPCFQNCVCEGQSYS